MMRGLVVAGTYATVVLMVGAPAAWAADDPIVEIKPRKVYQGNQVEIKVEVVDCPGRVAIADSDAFLEKSEMDIDQVGDLEGSATIRAKAVPGRYDVVIDCIKGKDRIGSFRVLKAKQPKRKTKVIYKTVYRNGTTYTTPVGPATGGGWLASQGRESGSQVAGVIALAVLVFGGAGVWFVRRRGIGR